MALDACLGVPGLRNLPPGNRPAHRQNVPALLGYHYGPKPNLQVAEFWPTATFSAI
jgi:hypothetical protein